MTTTNATARVLIVYIFGLIAGQAVAVGLGLLLDPYSKTAALAVFIPGYYAMYWIAWRFALFVADRSPEAEAESGGSSGVKAATWLLAPAVFALDLCD
jgi:hypothetical protein